MSRIQILTNAVADGPSLEFLANALPPTYNGNPFVGVSGVFDGATVGLEWKDGNGNWFPTDLVNDIWTQSKLMAPYINDAISYRLNVSNAGASTALNAWAYNCNLSA